MNLSAAEFDSSEQQSCMPFGTASHLLTGKLGQRYLSAMSLSTADFVVDESIPAEFVDS